MACHSVWPVHRAHQTASRSLQGLVRHHYTSACFSYVPVHMMCMCHCGTAVLASTPPPRMAVWLCSKRGLGCACTCVHYRCCAPAGGLGARMAAAQQAWIGPEAWPRLSPHAYPRQAIQTTCHPACKGSHNTSTRMPLSLHNPGARVGLHQWLFSTCQSEACPPMHAIHPVRMRGILTKAVLSFVCRCKHSPACGCVCGSGGGIRCLCGRNDLCGATLAQVRSG